MDENFREEQDRQFDSESQTQEQTQTASECIMEHRDRICILAVHFTPAISMQDITVRPDIHQHIQIHQEMLHRVQELPRRI